ncbi:MAG: ABC transporter ATP-binding protein [Clostridia bacterium]|nr:ABC transporter ATP-binding protein [Clostridia bacterium]
MLKILGLKKQYKKNEVLTDVNLSVKKGEVKALIGINGAGKSTLLEIVSGVKSADSGQIFVNDIDIFDKKARYLVKKILGYMPQTFGLFHDLTVEENLKYLCAIYNIDDTKQRVEELLELCYLTKKRKVLSRNLSGGYKQLLNLAGALVHSPKLLILDEPTSSMDPIFRKDFWKIIKKCNKEGMTILLITHHIEELLECDTFACLANGKIVFDDKVKLFKEKGFIDVDQIIAKFGGER